MPDHEVERLRQRVAELEASNDAHVQKIEHFQVSDVDLRLGELRYRSLVEVITAIVWNTPASGEFEVEQPRWSEFTGQSFAELRGWGWLNAVHPDDQPETARIWSSAVASRSLYVVEHRLRRHDGCYRNMSVRAVPILDQFGEIREWVGVHTDVTAQREAEATLREAKAMAEAANKAKSDFLANMSHEIRTPIHGILGMTELALDTELTPEQRRYLELVKSSADSLILVVNDILDFSKIEAGKLELEAISFSLRDRLGDTLKTLALRAHRKGLELACHFATDVPDALVGDPNRLGQIIINLVGNAIKFTAEGEVVLSVRLLRGGPTERNGEHNPPEHGDGHRAFASDRADLVTLSFSVSDTGPGIPRETQLRLFQPFTQADSSTTRHFGGTGLGLTIARRLVDLMGGKIGFESEPGRGSTFHFTATLTRQAAAAKEFSTLPNRLRGLRILVVDDNATNRMILEEMLTRWGMIVAVADSAAPAQAAMLRTAREGSKFAMVLSDVMMPGLDGFQFAEQIMQNADLAGTPVILLSSADRQPSAARCREAGVATYLSKPVKQSELLDAIVAALDRSADDASPSGSARDRVSIAGAAGQTKPLSLLLVEDNATNQLLAVTLLEKAGHAVATAVNGKDALAILSQRRFDVVLMDVQMPEMDGFEATRHIRERERKNAEHTPVIAMTASALTGDRARCLDAGMDAYLSKPIRAAELYQALAEFAGGNTGPDPERADCASPTREWADAPPEGIAGHELAAEKRSATTVDKAALLSRVGGREDRLRMIVQVFVKESAGLMVRIDEAIKSGDGPGLKLAAHSLKGAVGIFSVPRIVTLAQSLESLGQAGDFHEANDAANRLAEEIRNLHAALAALG